MLLYTAKLSQLQGKTSIHWKSLVYIYTYVGNATPTMSELNKYLIKYCEMWKSIGLKLGLEDDVVSVIQSNHPTQIEECFREVLRKWLKQDVTPTWSTLELAITNACREGLGLDPLQESKTYNFAWL